MPILGIIRLIAYSIIIISGTYSAWQLRDSIFRRGMYPLTRTLAIISLSLAIWGAAIFAVVLELDFGVSIDARTYATVPVSILAAGTAFVAYSVHRRKIELLTLSNQIKENRTMKERLWDSARFKAMLISVLVLVLGFLADTFIPPEWGIGPGVIQQLSEWIVGAIWVWIAGRTLRNSP
jgi:hypothetical protein